jgi:predicted nucleic acid-binding protein
MRDADSFFDTSVLLYLLSSEDDKADRVEELLAHSGNISVQVLNEFTAVATRKFALSLAEVGEVLDTVRALCTTHSLTEETYDRGIDIAQRYRFSVYDSMIVGSALLTGCKTLFSEDLQHGQIIDDQLTVINPFAKS